ncbi:sugar ABC transporter permease [Bosea sp. (in: a-proteobacteria)]|uniref:carbohydrate ABC transporter permease n=1 Tax=Bosea sp. (in: a-proteobacteria) TaxID=1871050 RepID=UPI0012075987|nr:sugar ABC transporter permease [Bosea sp. (in: a-proteobacteria)]TAJ34437.1 MAG: sugar ABC transporter permease [Bosea sp. (in: a-proteobacteria)]
MTTTSLPASLDDVTATAARESADFTPRYWLFSLPAVLVIAAVIVFPWIYTLFMSLQDWKIGGGSEFVGLANFMDLAKDQRFVESMGHTVYFTVLAVVLPIVFGTAAALVFHREFPARGLLRTIFIMPMMATPVAVALVWTMMFHPQLGVLNYLLSLVGIGPSAWVYDPGTVIPTLVMVEVWHWTPLVMLIVLGGLAGLPKEPYESALIDGANDWHMFRHITLPLVWPFIMVAIVIRTIDALKAFDTIFVITQGGPGTASETMNIFLYLQAFQFYKIGYASAVVVIFFIIIIMLSLLLLYARQKSKWNA